MCLYGKLCTCLLRILLAALHVHTIEIPCRAFSERVGSRIPLLESVGTSDYFSGRNKKNSNLNEHNFDSEDNWSGVVNFHCTQMSLVMSIRFIFGND